VDDFISKYGYKIALGIYRVGARSFVLRLGRISLVILHTL